VVFFRVRVRAPSPSPLPSQEFGGVGEATPGEVTTATLEDIFDDSDVAYEFTFIMDYDFHKFTHPTHVALCTYGDAAKMPTVTDLTVSYFIPLEVVRADTADGQSFVAGSFMYVAVSLPLLLLLLLLPLLPLLPLLLLLLLLRYQ